MAQARQETSRGPVWRLPDRATTDQGCEGLVVAEAGLRVANAGAAQPAAGAARRLAGGAPCAVRLRPELLELACEWSCRYAARRFPSVGCSKPWASAGCAGPPPAQLPCWARRPAACAVRENEAAVAGLAGGAAQR